MYKNDIFFRFLKQSLAKKVCEPQLRPPMLGHESTPRLNPSTNQAFLIAFLYILLLFSFIWNLTEKSILLFTSIMLQLAFPRVTITNILLPSIKYLNFNSHEWKMVSIAV